jgi:hypothetical protein
MNGRDRRILTPYREVASIADYDAKNFGIDDDNSSLGQKLKCNTRFH